MSANSESVDNQGEFRSKVAPSEPLTTKGHAPVVKIGNDAAPEFSAQTPPVGTAPSERTFEPNPISETPGQANHSDIAQESQTSASDTLGGSSSADIKELGLPNQGESSQQHHGSGVNKSSNQGNGLVGVGTDMRDPVRERGLDSDVPKGTSGKSGENRENILGAEEKEQVSAEFVAAERG